MIDNKSQIIKTVGLVGAGAMGRGIAQIVALAGIPVIIYDASHTAILNTGTYLKETFDKLIAKGKLSSSDAVSALNRIKQSDNIAELSECDLVIEAVIEDLEVKQSIFRSLEELVDDHCILASNTSSLSITAIASACKLPYRVAGFHFFNPVPLMKVVEVVKGQRTETDTVQALLALAKQIGHTPVLAKDMPGFIVNHAGRAMNTEGLRILSEGIATVDQVDRIIREQVGFKLGPFELLDLTSLDVSHPVMESIYHQFYEEPRFRPSPITAIRVSAGLLGRKTQSGFYEYENGKQVVPEECAVSHALPRQVWVSKRYPASQSEVHQIISCAGVEIDAGTTPADTSLILVTPYGEDATTAAIREGLDPARVVAVDTLFPLTPGNRRSLMINPATHPSVRDEARTLFAADGSPVTVLKDSTGFIAQRIVAMIVNVGCDIAQQQIASPKDIDLAVELGLGYPSGPLALGDRLGAKRILEILRNIYTLLGDPRYRPSPWLTRRALLELSLYHDYQ